MGADVSSAGFDGFFGGGFIWIFVIIIIIFCLCRRDP